LRDRLSIATGTKRTTESKCEYMRSSGYTYTVYNTQESQTESIKIIERRMFIEDSMFIFIT
jgi:hypothetical protein